MIDIGKKLNLEGIEIIGAGVDHSEGVTVTPDGTIYCGGEAGQIYRIDDNNPVQVADQHGFILGLSSDLENRVYAIDSANKCVWRYDPRTTATEKWLTGPVNDGFITPNHGAFGPDGSYYLTDSGEWDKQNGKVWVKRPGEEVKIFSLELTDFPNGNAVSRDGRKLYVVESQPSSISEVLIGATGKFESRRVLITLGLFVPDGIRIAADGSLIISFYSPNLVARWSEDAGLQPLANDPQGVMLAAPTNFEFCGDNLEFMIFTSLSRWQLSKANLGVVGSKPNYPSAELIGN
jgi:gluconolactonase